jgi:SAM-dependent methyltransferase
LLDSVGQAGILRRGERLDSRIKNLLYDHPEYYEVLYPETQDETPAMCRRMFDRFLNAPPRSILDIGCGTGRDLRSLRRTCPDCMGVDFLPRMVEYAKTRSSEIEFRAGDMRTLRLGRTFDVVVCFGSALLYALRNEDLDRTFQTFRTHCHEGSLLIIDVRNAAALLGDGFKPRIEGEVTSAIFSARYVAEHSFDRRRQLLCRKRTWRMPDGNTAEDVCKYRLLLPEELAHRLGEYGFNVLGMYDNKGLEESDFTGPTMYTVARYGVISVDADEIRQA